METPEPAYPAQFEADVTLRDGSTVHLRPIRWSDDDAMLDLFGRFSPRTVYYRFHHNIKQMTKHDVQFYTHVDHEDTFALLATRGDPADEQILAVGRYARIDGSDHAECAFVVEDAFQHQGIATYLLHHLAAIARDKGIRTFEAEVMGDNRQMMEVFRDSGYLMTAKFELGTLHVTMDIAPETEASK